MAGGRGAAELTAAGPGEPVAGAPPAARVSLWRIFTAFLRLGCTSFGGGTAAWLYREMVLRRRWVDDQSFLAMMALGQILPGSNGVKLTVLIGQRLRGAAGAALALGGLLAGPFAVVLAIGSLYADIGANATVQGMLEGVAAVVIGLTFATGLGGLVRGAPAPMAWAIAAATVLCIGVLRWPLLPVVAGLAPVSIGWAFAAGRRR